MKFEVTCPVDRNIVIHTGDGNLIRFNCDYEYEHTHEIECDSILSIDIEYQDGFVRSVTPDDPEFAKRIKPYEEPKKVEDVGVFREFQNVDDEPENIGLDFLRAQLSTKHQMLLRNVMAIVSSVAVLIAFILEKLGIL